MTGARVQSNALNRAFIRAPAPRSPTLQSDIRHDFAAQPFEINGFKGGQTLAISIEIVTRPRNNLSRLSPRDPRSTKRTVENLSLTHFKCTIIVFSTIAEIEQFSDSLSNVIDISKSGSLINTFSSFRI